MPENKFLGNYRIVSRTLLKCKDTKFKTFKYKYCSYQGKILYTVDQENVMRALMFKNVELFLEKNFNEIDQNSLNFEDMIKTKRI